MTRPSGLLLLSLLCSIARFGVAAPVINEVMFHPAGAPENPKQEWIEIYNPSATETVTLTGWRLSKGVSFAFPSGTTLPPNSYIVVAADTATFTSQYPAVSNVVGGWTGQLSNSGERVRLENNLGDRIGEGT